jgi:hypothetical protein
MAHSVRPRALLEDISQAISSAKRLPLCGEPSISLFD